MAALRNRRAEETDEGDFEANQMLLLPLLALIWLFLAFLLVVLIIATLWQKFMPPATLTTGRPITQSNIWWAVIAVLSLLVAAPVILVACVDGSNEPSAVLLVEQGMSRAQVLKAAGPPVGRDTGGCGEKDCENWTYGDCSVRFEGDTVRYVDPF